MSRNTRQALRQTPVDTSEVYVGSGAGAGVLGNTDVLPKCAGSRGFLFPEGLGVSLEVL